MATAARFDLKVLLAASLLVLLAALPVRADDVRAPGVAADDSRQIVDIEQAPWSSIVRVQTNIGGKCTGTVVAPRLVLTAAHCLYNPRTRRLLAPLSLHVLIGYARGDYRTHLLVEAAYVPPAYDGTRPGDNVRHDWTLLRLSGVADAAPLPLAPHLAATTDRIAVAGYSQDRVHLLMADRDCKLLRAAPAASGTGGTLLFHDCSASKGTSGGPLLIRTDAGWLVGGVNIGITGSAGNLALWPEGLDQAMRTLSSP